MFRAVLFDLDGTLLDIDLGCFLHDYFAALGPVVGEVTGLSPVDAIAAVVAGTDAMCAAHPGRTNRDVFNERFASVTGRDLCTPEHADVLDRFYRDRFPSLRANHGPKAGARQAVEAARSAGMLVVVATNPIFPRAAIHERMRWAGLEPGEFDLVTSYETSEACKPDPHYFTRVAGFLGVEPDECLMVGDDATLDMPAARVGMRTFFVGEGDGGTADWAGDLFDFTRLISRGA